MHLPVRMAHGTARSVLKCISDTKYMNNRGRNVLLRLSQMKVAPVVWFVYSTMPRNIRAIDGICFSVFFRTLVWRTTALPSQIPL